MQISKDKIKKFLEELCDKLERIERDLNLKLLAGGTHA